MKSGQLLNQVELVRALTLETFDSLTEEMADIIPAGFNNNIRWNLGHILIVQDQLAAQFASIPAQLPIDFMTLFGNHTSPRDWNRQVPTLEQLANELRNQVGHIRGHLENRLEEAARKPFKRLDYRMETIGEILAFSLHHEGLHLGVIGSLRKAIQSGSY
ncbi:MAG TPA: DinB family protein [Bacillota bacterium]|nr:DinB family protein [Bacillota bacterium]